jgi:heme-degrading monooxygenase HmoA
MQTAAETGYLNAMAAATYLSNKGLPFRKAHEVIGNAVRLGLDLNLELNAIPLTELRKLSDYFAEDFFTAITLRATLDCHDVTGGTNTARVAEALAAAKARLSGSPATEAAVTTINVFSVDPADQQKLIDLLTESTNSSVIDAPGFISSTLFRSLDGRKVAMHATWRSEADYNAMRSQPRPFLQQALTFATFDPGMYQAVDTFHASTPGGARG